jgi:hypothetical protein
MLRNALCKKKRKENGKDEKNTIFFAHFSIVHLFIEEIMKIPKEKRL